MKTKRSHIAAIIGIILISASVVIYHALKVLELNAYQLQARDSINRIAVFMEGCKAVEGYYPKTIAELKKSYVGASADVEEVITKPNGCIYTIESFADGFVVIASRDSKPMMLQDVIYKRFSNPGANNDKTVR